MEQGLSPGPLKEPTTRTWTSGLQTWETTNFYRGSLLVGDICRTAPASEHGAS